MTTAMLLIVAAVSASPDTAAEPTPPRLVQIVPGDGSVYVDIEKRQEDVDRRVRYGIHVSKTSGGPYEQVNLFWASNYKNNVGHTNGYIGDLTNDKTYYFVVSTESSGQESGCSNEVAVMPVKNTAMAVPQIDGYSFGIMYGVALADDLSKPIGEPVKLMEADQPWEKVRYDENRCNEGAFVLKHDGRYYMTYSANHTGFPHYGVGYATADNPLGPWTKAEENPIAATDVDIGLSGPGHSCITRSPDGTEIFIVYHTHADAQKP